jgi:general secretion pathway protein I
MTATSLRRVRGVAGRRCGEQGFALLEILVAFVVLALGLGGIFVGVATAMRTDVKTEATRSALRVAQSRLEGAGVIEALVPGHREGRIGSIYTWRQTVSAIEPATRMRDSAGRKPEARATDTMTAFWVEVAVQAGDRTVVKLAAVKLAPAAKR